jgi:signal peptidase II
MPVIAASVIGLDQATKAFARAHLQLGHSVAVIPGLQFDRVDNRGIAFSLFSGASGLILIMLVVLIGVLVLGWRYRDRDGVTLATGLVAGGAMGNLIDRLTSGQVTDFIRLPDWPVFNVADIAITLGAIILALILSRAPKNRSTDRPMAEDQREHAADAQWSARRGSGQ